MREKIRLYFILNSIRENVEDNNKKENDLHL